MLVFLNCVLKAWGFSLDLLGQPVTAHFGIPRSIPAHLQYLSSLFNWSWRDVKSLDITARSSV